MTEPETLGWHPTMLARQWSRHCRLRIPTSAPRLRSEGSICVSVCSRLLRHDCEVRDPYVLAYVPDFCAKKSRRDFFSLSGFCKLTCIANYVCKNPRPSADCGIEYIIFVLMLRHISFVQLQHRLEPSRVSRVLRALTI